MATLQKLNQVVQTLTTQYIPRAKARRFLSGVQAFALTAFSSLNSAGRLLAPNRSTGENRIRRTVTDHQLTGLVQTLLLSEALGGRSGRVYCSLDHSQFGPFCIAVLAVSVRRGRAIPIWCQVSRSRGALIAPLLAALAGLLGRARVQAPRLQPVLVMDRWFAGAKLFRLLARARVGFICRLKAGRKVAELPWADPGETIPVGEVSQLETTCACADQSVRLVRSTLRSGMGEPWFLLTNLPGEVSRQQVLHRYAERFEIEESFKDLKRVQRYEWQQIRLPEVMRSVLLFTFLGWWLLWRHVARQGKALVREHPKKQRSWFRQTWEYLCYLARPPDFCLVT